MPLVTDYDGRPVGEQLFRVRRAMLDRKWHTIRDLQKRTAYPAQSISARLRDLRKARFGGHVVKRRPAKMAAGFEYRLIPRGRIVRRRRDAGKRR